MALQIRARVQQLQIRVQLQIVGPSFSFRLGFGGVRCCRCSSCYDVGVCILFLVLFLFLFLHLPPALGLLLLCLGVITYVPELSLFLVRRVEGTESVELRWARRGASGEEDGLGALRWSLRGPDADPDWELLVEPPPGAPRAEAADLVLRYRPLDLDRLAALQAGEAVRCSFELGRADTEGWQAAARWEDELSAVAELAGRVLEPTEVSVRPAEGRLSELTLGSENWAASAVQIDAVEDGRVRGALRGVVVHFPEDESLPPELYDVEVAFDCTAVLDVLVFEPPGAGARTREIPDVRLLYRVAGGEAEGGRTTFILERTRTRPLHLYVSWSAVLESPEALAGAELSATHVRPRARPGGPYAGASRRGTARTYPWCPAKCWAQ